MSGLVASGLTVALGGRPVLQGLDLSIQPGEVTVIVGPNGAGKSTLLTRLAGLHRPDSGAVALDGAPLAAMPARERARRIAYLEQTPELAWAIDVRTLAGLGRTPFTGARGLSAEDHAAVDEALAATGMTAFARRIVTSLSGGERARALIARALAGRPPWLLADEPLTGLDIGHQLDTLDLLRSLARGGAGVIVTLHDLSAAARVADRLIVLSQGRILADGPPGEALTADVLAQAYGVRARVTAGEGGPQVEVVGRR